MALDGRTEVSFDASAWLAERKYKNKATTKQLEACLNDIFRHALKSGATVYEC